MPGTGPAPVFNGSTATFGQDTLGEGLIDASWSEKPSGEANTTVTTDTEATSEAGIPAKELTLTVLGETNVAIGTKADLTLTTPAGGETITNAYLSGKDASGKLNGEVTTKLTFKKSKYS